MTIVAVGALALVSPAAAQQEPQMLRAVRDLPGDLVRDIAAGAEVSQFDPQRFPDLREFNARRVIQVKCGSVREEYWSELQRINNISLTLDESLGDRAYTIRWPACLYLEQDVEAVVQPNESAFKIYERLLGDKPSKAMVIDFFGADSLDQIKSVQPGDKLPVKRRSRISTILPVNPFLGRKLTMMTERAGHFSDPQLRAVQAAVASVRQPEMVIAAGYTASTGTIEEPLECADAMAPTDLTRQRVASAYRYARERLADLQSSRVPVEVMIVDNGFLGGAKTFAGFMANPGFPGKHYARYTGGEIGPTLFNGTVPPWIAAPEPFHAVAGHGTHVAMLALGGPDFLPKVSELTADDTNTFLRLSFINVGNGKDVLLPNSSGELRDQLAYSNFRVVNMSIEYQDDADATVREDFRYIFTNRANANKLFIVAAGNDAKVANDRFPAAFGGEGKSNVIAVGAVRQDGVVAQFSNWGPTVDFAAPGCGVESIINHRYERLKLSGTSQAAPQVSFVAAMLHTLGGMTPSEIKTRLLVSGSLLANPKAADPTGGRKPTAVRSRSQLDAERAFYLFDDVLELADGRRYLGTIKEVNKLTCKIDEAPVPQAKEALWAFKRDASQAWVFPGRSSASFQTPCAWEESPDASVIFEATRQITENGPKPLGPDEEALIHKPLGEVFYVVARHR
ncbi:S8 family peptidase [Sphingomonas gilva]|uniref:S8 family peptidase n=1 Tax=Sphingomonas gilva TaxID=2305907 RepID=UPI001CA3EF86|nr:S8 family serine peptidase [Sphingomonas gilva]